MPKLRKTWAVKPVQKVVPHKKKAKIEAFTKKEALMFVARLLGA